MSAKQEATKAEHKTKKFGKSERSIPHHTQKAKKFYPAEDEAKPKKVREADIIEGKRSSTHKRALWYSGLSYPRNTHSPASMIRRQPIPESHFESQFKRPFADTIPVRSANRSTLPVPALLSNPAASLSSLLAVSAASASSCSSTYPKVFSLLPVLSRSMAFH